MSQSESTDEHRWNQPTLLVSLYALFFRLDFPAQFLTYLLRIGFISKGKYDGAPLNRSLCLCPKILSVNIAMIGCEAGIPQPGLFGLLKVQGRCFFDTVEKHVGQTIV